MKKKLLVSFCILAFSHIALAQNLLWSKKTDQSQANTGLVTDKNGIVYSYGLRRNMTYTANSSPDTLGSFLESYTTNGTVVFTKKWAMPFYIQKMEYDGNQYFYFAATFSGTQIINGITIISQGNTDGVTGKMDLTGQIIWMKTFGGTGADGCNDVCFNSADNSIYATGSIRDTLFLNNTFESINQQSAIILHYSSTGAFINHKLYDFVPERNLGNINSGREIIKDPSGNFFLLMDRDGKNWNGSDTVAGSIMGRYIIKLDSNLDTVWSTYIIGPASYYGWSGNSLRTAANGDVYIAIESSFKYGGEAKLSRLNGNSGQITWNYLNNDGVYTDLFIDGNTVYLIGNEGANVCPCEYNNRGYYVLKKFDENNALLGETRFSNVYLNIITKDASGNLFVTGNFYKKTVIIGQDTLMGDIDTLFSPGVPRYFGRFLTKLSDINCTAPIISVSVPSSYVHYYPICAGDTATLTVNLTQGTFEWSNGITGAQTNVNNTGLYSVMNTQPNGCKAYSLPVYIEVSAPSPNTPSIISGNITVCSGTSNTYSITAISNATSYTWTLPSGWTGTSTDNLINTTASAISGNISVTANNGCGASAPQIISVTVSAAFLGTPGVISGDATVCSGSSNTYSVTAVNGSASYTWILPLGWTGSSTSTSINVVASSIGGDISVTENGVCGVYTPKTITVPTIDTTVTQAGDTLTANMPNANYVWLDCNNNAAIANATNQDFIPPASGNYAVIITKNNCMDTSACKNFVMTGIVNVSVETDFSVFPNPTNNLITIDYKANGSTENIYLEIKNSVGQTIYTSSVSSFQGEYKKAIDLSEESPGIYFVQIIADRKTIVKKIILN